MAISTASPFLPEPPRASRSQYQRARDLLPYAWPSLREAHDLRPIDFQLLTVVLVNQPGRLFRQKGSRPTNDGRRCKRETLGFADWLGISRTSANESINRLNEAGLLWGLMYEQGDELPFGTREPAHEDARPFVKCAVYGPRTVYHVAVRRSDGRVEDPSRVLGMR